MSNILEVKNLKVSFRTSGGTVKAVRDISFALERGKTIAIVGESGSGKSVTSKAIMGILAGNAIVEGGKIIYDGKDLLKMSEEDMCKIRGDRISMIFQDPLSSLNPIVKTGKQITEAMLLKNKTSRKAARAEFNALLAQLQKQMGAAIGDADHAKALCHTFDTFCIEANRLENSYNNALSTAIALRESISSTLFRLSKKQKVDVKTSMKNFLKSLKRIDDPFLTAHCGEQMHALRDALRDEKDADPTPALTKAQQLLTEIIEQERPNFFRIGYYTLKNPHEKIHQMPVAQLNDMALTYLNEQFMMEFIEKEKQGLERSFNESLEKKKALIAVLDQAAAYFEKDFEKKPALAYAKKLADQVEASIDPLEINKDSLAYTFRTSLTDAIEKVFYYKKNNPKEEARYARQSKKREAMIARGKTVSWKVVPKEVLDLEELWQNIVEIITEMKAHYESLIASADQVDHQARSIELIDNFKEKASRAVYRITPAMAKEKALKLMEEVGISDPQLRYNQYPFQFSGGMRQRIVIAIALSADPDILICDEPTTALDVTIQAQILELINQLKAERNLSVIFITHDLGVVANMADDIAVMYAGKIVEYGTDEDIFYDPRHPYTWALLGSMPDLETKEKLDAIPGTPPNMIYPPVGDAFAARNKYAMQIDFEAQPPMFEVSETHRAATWLLHPGAPKVELPQVIKERIQRMQKAGGDENG